MGKAHDRVIFTMCRTVMVTRIRQDTTCGENRLIKNTVARGSRHPRRAFRDQGKGPTRPNFHGTAIMTVIFLHLEERARFLPAPPPSPTSYFDHYSRFDVVGNARRQRFFLNRPRRLRHIPFFFPHLFAFPQLVPAAVTTPPSWGRTIRRALTVKRDYPHVT